MIGLQALTINKTVDDKKSNVSILFGKWRALGPACLVMENPTTYRSMNDYIESHSMRVICIGPKEFLEFQEYFLEESFGIFVVCLDCFDGLGQIYNSIRKLRDAKPSTPVVLLSSSMKYSDFSTERLAICDVSVKLPVNVNFLDEVYSFVGENNSTWIARSLETNGSNIKSSAAQGQLSQDAIHWWNGLGGRNKKFWQGRIEMENNLTNQGAPAKREQRILLAYQLYIKKMKQLMDDELEKLNN